MSISIRRMTSAALAVAFVLALGTEQASAQYTPGGANVGPAGGVASTTAPSNGQGTPAGGTGVIGTTRVGPSGIAPAPTPSTTPMATAPAPRQARRVRHRRTHHRSTAARPATEVGTQSQAGTNGSVMPASK